MVTKKTERILISISVPQVRDFIQPKHTVGRRAIYREGSCYFLGNFRFLNYFPGGFLVFLDGFLIFFPAVEGLVISWFPGTKNLVRL